MSFEREISNSINLHWILTGAFATLLLYYYFVRPWRFFQRYAIEYDCGIPPFGSYYRRIFQIEPWSVTLQKLYSKYPNERVVGLHEIGGEPAFLIRDPELVKQITIRDFSHFVSRYSGVNKTLDPLIGHELTNLKNDEWRRIRNLLTPLFTSQKFKQIMVPSLVETRVDLINYLKDELAKCDDIKQVLDVDMMELSTRSGIDGFCLAALGIKTDSLRKNDDGFYAVGKSYTNHLENITGSEYFSILRSPYIMKYIFGKTLTTQQDDLFYRNTFTNIADSRIIRQIKRNDYLRLLQSLRDEQDYDTNVTHSSGKFFASFYYLSLQHLLLPVNHFVCFLFLNFIDYTEAEIISQLFEFYESVITENNVIMTFLAQQLAQNTDIQNRVYDEFWKIQQNLEDQPLTYESLKEMKYMDMVISEGLRMCPIATELQRRATKRYTLEDNNGVKIPIKPGDAIWIPIYALQMDEKYFPNPMVFDPERFNDENKVKHISGSYAPFGMGPRDCIGCRYATIELKITFYYLLINFVIENGQSDLNDNVNLLKLRARK